MKTNIGLSENCSERLSSIKGLFPKRVNKVFITLLLGLLFMSAMTIPAYMSYQMALQMLEPAAAAHLESLVTDVYPTAYLVQGEITTQGDGAPVVAIFDAASVNMLYSDNPALSQVELLKITANTESDLPASIDLLQLEVMPNLKYLLVEFVYDACGGGAENCLNPILWEIITGTSTQIMVIYDHSIPE
ncbi:MAG: hypothetical protein PHT26_09915 [Lentimicrobiaceae bacterium]|nr:hypothetical protein [Lentimicrobiaceae bacterium]